MEESLILLEGLRHECDRNYLGFSSQSHFSKVFKEYAELTPFEYRQMHKHY